MSIVYKLSVSKNIFDTTGNAYAEGVPDQKMLVICGAAHVRNPTILIFVVTASKFSKS